MVHPKYLLWLQLTFLVVGPSLESYSRFFPSNFLFGVSTSAYQTEGAWKQDGKGESIWDVYTHSANSTVAEKANGDMACDSYNRFQSDLDLLRNLNVNMYRFSIPWTRIFPNGSGREPNRKALEHYKTMVTVLHYLHIEPVVVLYHFDLPAVLEKNGGLLGKDFPQLFANYARACFKELGQYVKYWITFNEPTIFCDMKSAEKDYQCVHNVLKAHAAAYHVYHKEFKHLYNGSVSIIHRITYPGPLTNSAKDKEASERKLQFDLGWVANPIYNGDYPAIMKTRIANISAIQKYPKSRLPEFTAEERKLLKGTSDFFALTTFWSYVVTQPDKINTTARPSRENDAGIIDAGPKVNEDSGAWGIQPLVEWIRKEYHNPSILFAGNGLVMDSDTEIDEERMIVLDDYISSVGYSMDRGAHVIGYTINNFMDSFEWEDGYTSKLGLYKVDFTSPKRTRTIRKSGTFYKQLATTHCLVGRCHRK